jgi:mono/diheme cytochrome c family protein
VASPFLGQEDAIAAGQQTYRARCIGCHKAGAGAGPRIFKTKLDPKRFIDTVTTGRQGTAMPAFGTLLSREEIWQVHAYLMSRDGL